MVNHSIRLYITEGCNANCPSCFNHDARTSIAMDVHKYEQICQYFKNNGIKRVKIMGGEPTTHPQFLDFMLIAQSYFPEVILFTNGINDEVLNYFPRMNDSIVFNFTFHKIWRKEKLMLDRPGRRAFEIQVKPNSDIKEYMNWLGDLNSEFIVNVLTLDCTSDIFKHRDILLKKIQILQEFMESRKLKYSMDHRIPLCFLYKSGITVPNINFSLCSLSCAGLIDSSYRLKFCNQYVENTGIEIFKNDMIIPYKLITNYLQSQFMRIQHNNLTKICMGCIFYGERCNGGCFLERCEKDNIMKNTQFPIQ